MPRRVAAPRQHEAGVTRRDCDGDTAADRGALARPDRRGLGRVQVEAGVVVVARGSAAAPRRSAGGS